MNEFERRFLDVTQQNLYLKAANAGGQAPEYFGYVLKLGDNGIAMTDGVVFQGAIAIQADAWFLWEYLSVAVTIPFTAGLGAPEQFTDGGNLMLQITNTGTGNDLYNVPAGFAGLPAALSAGSPIAAAAGIPYMFPTPLLLPPNTNINISVAKYGTAAADNPDPAEAVIMLNGARIQVWA